MKEHNGPDEIDVYVGKAIRERRKLLGLSMVDLAAATGVSWQQVSKNETAANRFSASRLHQIATALKCKVGDFFPPTEGTVADTVDDRFNRIRSPKLRRAVLTLIDNVGQANEG